MNRRDKAANPRGLAVSVSQGPRKGASVADDQQQRRRPINPSLLRLPQSLEETGDPVGENPFSEADPRHSFWARVTRDAVERVSRIKSEWFLWQQTHAAGRSTDLNDIIESNARFRLEKRRVISDEFQIWASRGVQLLFSDGDVQNFDAWLVSYAAAVLEMHAHQM